MQEGVWSYLLSRPARMEPFTSPAGLHSPDTVTPRDFQAPGLGAGTDREPAGSVSCSAAAFPPATPSLELPNPLFCCYHLFRP